MTTEYTPTPLVIRSAIDEIGSLLDVDRIPAEDLASYSKRLYDTYANRASSAYEGLINGINRELGLEKTECIEVSIRDIGAAALDANIVLTSSTLTDNNSFTNLIDGTSVIAVGTILTDTTQSWIPSYLRGYKLKIDTVEYEIIDNTSTTVTIQEEMSGLVGETYIIEADWEDNSLIGLGLRIGEQLFRISENTSKIIEIESGNLSAAEGTTYKITAFNPKFEVTASQIFLYKEFINDDNFQLETTIDLREDVTFHRDIITIINGSKFFKAENLLDSRTEIFSFSLKRQSSEEVVIGEIAPATRFFKLENKSIKEGSINFAEVDVFLHEVLLDEVSQAAGNYNINYDKGVVTVNTLPSGSKQVSYTWNNFPFTVISSPVVVNAFNRDDTQEFLFSQVEMERYTNYKERFISSQPKADMIEFIAELLAVNPQSWGK